MSEAVDVIQLDNNTRVEIYLDFDPANPREEWDNLGTMVCFHRRMNLGDDNHGFHSPDDLNDYLKENKAIVLPIHAYEHSGITITANVRAAMRYPFSDPWDSGILGVIFVTYEKIRKEYGWKYITSARAKQIAEYLKNEVETYDDYLTGSVYGYKVICNQCEVELDSCWGYYGYDHKKSGLLESAEGQTCEDCEAIENRLDSVLEASNV